MARHKRVFCRGTCPAPTERYPNRVKVAWGDGPTYAWALASCRDWIKRDPNREYRDCSPDGWSFAPHKMPQPKFKIGDKVRETEYGSVSKVLALPDHPRLEGCICYAAPNIGGIRWSTWASENRFELAK